MQSHEIPPPVRMIELLGGFRISQALYAAAVLGIADQLVAGRARWRSWPGRPWAHAPSLYRLLRALAAEGVFTEPRRRVALTARPEDSDQPASCATGDHVDGDALRAVRRPHPLHPHRPARRRAPVRRAVLHLAVAPPRACRQVHRRDGEPDRRVKTAASRPCRSTGSRRSSTSAAPTARSSRPSWRRTRRCAACYSTFPTSLPAHPHILADTASATGPTASAATSSTPCHPAATPTSRPSCCTTGPTRAPSASSPTSLPPGTARGCWCSIRRATRR